MPPPLIYIILCIGMAFLGRDRKFGFWGYFFASLFLSPFIGALLVLGSDRRPQPIDY